MWKSVSCAVQGSGHKKTQTPCQDKTYERNQNGVHIIALADGAGSASLSHYGAQCVVSGISELIAEHFRTFVECDDGWKVKQLILDELKRLLLEQADSLGCEIKELASTLLFAAVCEDQYILAHIGDGVIGYLDGSELKVASTPDNGEFSNVTTFVTSNEALTSMRLYKGTLKQISAFVLMSDGTEQSLYHKPTKTLANIVVKLMHRTCLTSYEVMKRQLEEALSSVISHNTQDDCSIAILARPNETLCPIEELDEQQRRELFQVSSLDHHAHKRIVRYNTILEILREPHSLEQIAGMIHLKPKYTKKQMDHMISVGLVIKKGIWYSRS